MTLPFERVNSAFLTPEFSEAENVSELTALGLRKKKSKFG
jgi:hypothetical protein